jgi:hypothetical protein
MSLNVRFVKSALERQSAWDLGNQTLYDLCRKHPDHGSVDVIVAKMWLIGRSYASSIERRRDSQSASGDDFYLDTVGPKIKRAGIYTWFDALRELSRPNLSVVVPVHKRLTDMFREISGLEMRSLASKYLHFHFPRAVYIYDERASSAIRLIRPRLRLSAPACDRYDTTYARFFQGCTPFHDELEHLLGRAVTPREVDKVLLAVAARTS